MIEFPDGRIEHEAVEGIGFMYDDHDHDIIA